MNIRNYNIYFHTHTVSGIIICAVLYVIFFAGSFSFFKKEISAWQKNTSYANYQKDNNSYDKLLDSLSGEMDLHGRDISFYIQRSGVGTYVSISASNDTIRNKANLAKADTGKEEKGKEKRRGRQDDSKYFNYDFVTQTSGDYASSYDMGEFLYRLHFLAQLNQVPIKIGIAPFGYFIAGLTSFLFLFALITGLLLHWDKLVSNFFVFRPFSKWKTVWTDMHTALGVLGFPFQFLYAVTGVVLIINSVLIIPFSKILYEGNQEKVYQDLGYSRSIQYDYSYKPMEEAVRLTDYIHLAEQKWPGAVLSSMFVKNYGDANMHVIMEFEPAFDKHFAGSGILDVGVKDQKIVLEKSPVEHPTYIDKVRSILYRLHLADFGGYPVKVMYFVLGIMGCLVITSGILIWLVARDKNNVLPRKRKFNFWTANVFMSICLTMLPVTAITFIAIKVSPNVDQDFIYHVFFYSWLLFSLYYIIRKNINRTNRETLLLGGFLAFCVPVANGIMTGNWLWNTMISRSTDIFVIDLLWLLIAIVAMIAYFKSRSFFRKVGSRR